MAHHSNAAVVDYCRQVVANCGFISPKGAEIVIITAKEPATAKIRATAVRVDGRGRKQKRTVLFSDVGITMMDAFEALHTKSAEAVHNHVSTVGYEPIPTKKDSKSWDGSTAGSGSDSDSGSDSETRSVNSDATASDDSDDNDRYRRRPSAPAAERANMSRFRMGGYSKSPATGRAVTVSPGASRPRHRRRRSNSTDVVDDDDDFRPPRMAPFRPGGGAPTFPNVSIRPGGGFPGGPTSMGYIPPGARIVPAGRPGPPMQPPPGSRIYYSPGASMPPAIAPMPITVPAPALAPTPAAAPAPAPAQPPTSPPPHSPPRDLRLNVTWEGHQGSTMIFVKCAPSKRAIGREAVTYIVGHRDAFGPADAPSSAASSSGPNPPNAPPGLRPLVKEAVFAGSQRYDLRAYPSDDLSRMCDLADPKDIPLFEVVVYGKSGAPMGAAPAAATSLPLPPTPAGGATNDVYYPSVHPVVHGTGKAVPMADD